MPVHFYVEEPVCCCLAAALHLLPVLRGAALFQGWQGCWVAGLLG